MLTIVVLYHCTYETISIAHNCCSISLHIFSPSSHLEGSSTSVGRPGHCKYPVLAVENVDVCQPILLDVSFDGIHVSQLRSSYRSLTLYTMSRTVLVVWHSSIRLTCTYLRNRFCIRCVVIGWTVAASLISSFRLCSLRLTPCIHSNILISFLFISISSFFFIVQHAAPYVIVGLVIVLYIVCYSLTGTFLSYMTPVTSLHLFHASRIRFLQYVVVPPSASSNIDPRYLNVVTFLISSRVTPLELWWQNNRFAHWSIKVYRC